MSAVSATPERRSPLQLVRGSLVPMIAISAIAAAAALLLEPSGRSTAVLLGLLFLGLCLAIVIQDGFRHGRRHLFSPLVLLTAYHALGVGLKGVLDLTTNESKIGHGIDPTSDAFTSTMSAVFAYALLGILSMFAGDRLARRGEKRTATMPCPAPLLDPRALGGAVALGVGMTCLGAGVLIAKFGAIVLTDPSFIAVAGTFGLFWLYPLMYASLYAWGLPILNVWSAGRPAARWQMLAMMVTSALVYLITSSKAVLIAAVLILVIGRHRTIRPVRVFALLSLTAAFLVALPLLYLHREYGFTQASLSRITPEMALAGVQIFIGRSYLADSFAAVLLYTPRVYPFRWGSTWLELFYFWIPRSWWPGKPLSFSLEFGHTYMSSYFQHSEAYFSPTLLGDAYLNLGPLGIVLVFLLIGYVMRRWYWWLMGPTARPETVMVYAVSAYWIGIGSEQSLAVILELGLSYVAIASLLAVVARRGYLRLR